MRVWTQNVAGNHRENSPSLALLDLFAGTGWCRNADRHEEWPGTATLLAQCLSRYPTRHPTVLFLNTYSARLAEARAQLESLKETIGEIKPPKKPKLVWCQKPLVDAVEEAKVSFDRNFPSLWVLDPYAAQDLPWAIVKEIASLTGTKFSRRPELFINLMTFDLQENMDNNPHIMTTALGMQEAEWHPRVDEMIRDGLNKREAIVHLYGEKLEGLYGRPPYYIEVEGVHGNIVYVLFFCSSNDAGFHMMRKEAIPRFVEWHDRKWKPRAKSIAASKKVDKKAAEAGHRQAKLDLGNDRNP